MFYYITPTFVVPTIMFYICSVKVCEMMFNLASKLATARTSGTIFLYIFIISNTCSTVATFPNVFFIMLDHELTVVLQYSDVNLFPMKKLLSLRQGQKRFP